MGGEEIRVGGGGVDLRGWGLRKGWIERVRKGGVGLRRGR